MLTALFIIAMVRVLAADPKTQTLSNETAIYEKIADLRIVVSNWKLITHLNLRDLSSEIVDLGRTVTDFEKLCGLQGLNPNLACTQQQRILKSKLNEITHIGNFLTFSLDSSSSRRKRALLGVVGQLSRQLFGTLTEEDGKFLDEQVRKLERNKMNVTATINQQITVLSNLYKINNETSEAIKRHWDAYQNKMTQFVGDLNSLARSGNETVVRLRLDEIFSLGLYALTSYQNRQSSLYAVLVDPDHELSPDLINPILLLNELQKLQNIIPKDVTLPLTPMPRNIFHFYHLLKVKISPHKGRLFLEVNIPLIHEIPFEIFHVTAVPQPVNPYTYSIPELENALLAVSTDQDSFFLPEEKEISSCPMVDGIKYCQINKPVYRGDHGLCVRKLFRLRKTAKICKEKFLKITTESWIRLLDPNRWLYVLPEPTRVTFSSEKGSKSTEIQGVGLVSGDQKSLIKTDKIIILPSTTGESEFRMEFSALPNDYVPPENIQNTFLHLTPVNVTLTDPKDFQRFSVTLPELSRIHLEKTERLNMKSRSWSWVLSIAVTTGSAILGCVLIWSVCLGLQICICRRMKSPKQIMQKVENLPPPPPFLLVSESQFTTTPETNSDWRAGISETPKTCGKPVQRPVVMQKPTFSRPASVFEV